MAEKTNLYEIQIESIVKWLSCNGEAWGMGPTVVFASAAALFLYNELQATVFLPGDHPQVSIMEKTLISTMVVGMLALMIHLWVCSMRFFQYYLDTLIRDSPSMLLEMTTASLLGKSEVLPIGPLTRFLKQQQPQIHITVCWFLSLCYADYVRKHYCRRFNMPYLEQWQTELHERASNGVHTTMQKVNSFVGSIHRRLRNYTSPPSDVQTVRSHPRSTRRWRSEERPACRGHPPSPPSPSPSAHPSQCPSRVRQCARACSASPARLPHTRWRNSEDILRKPDVRAMVRRTPGSALLAPSCRRSAYSDNRPSWIFDTYPIYI